MNLKKFKPLIRKFVIIKLFAIAVAILSIVAWEAVRDPILDHIPDNTIVVERATSTPSTINAIIEEQAYSWLKSPEALEYAKEKVTEEVVEELSKR